MRLSKLAMPVVTLCAAIVSVSVWPEHRSSWFGLGVFLGQFSIVAAQEVALWMRVRAMMARPVLCHLTHPVLQNHPMWQAILRAPVDTNPYTRAELAELNARRKRPMLSRDEHLVPPRDRHAKSNGT